MDNRDLENIREMFQMIVRRFGLLQREGAQCCGISLAHSHILYEINKSPGITVNELAAVLGLDKSTTSRHVQALTGEGLVEGRPSEEDRRYLNLVLTEKGRELQSRIAVQMAGFIREILEFIPQDKRDEVVRSIGLLSKAMHQSTLSASSSLGCCTL
ncbi:MAG: MarR family winged helix-turn-helix transcriptional regulator [Bacillota bacterium]|uniref:MarR family winged helix-turn-helix transcriptional regulator n=1 Tax=Desulforudis sp. DRI-14 TaxID=3459793 RepID=UPI003494876D